MKETYVDIINLRRQVFAAVAQVAYQDKDLSELNKLSYKILPGEEARYRSSIFKERAILEERIRLTMGLEVRKPGEFQLVTDGMEDKDMDTYHFKTPLVNVIPFACEACPTKTYKVSNNCRKCIAHPCKNVCPKNAITIGKHAAIIDQDKCIKCGRCKEACPYSAIINYDRPCASVCGVQAIGSDYLGRAEIDEDKCVSCGRCVTQCPFGAIMDKSQIYQLVKSLKRKDVNNYAIVAPSFSGQFGPLATPTQVVKAIKALGFTDVIEVSLGADITTMKESKEFLEKVPSVHPFLGTSCCASWGMLIEKNFPEQAKHVSDTGSPMAETARYIKEFEPDAIITFVGPCFSKKLEAMREELDGLISYVITYEEMMGMFVGNDIDPAEFEDDADLKFGSSLGRGYAIAGGVAEAVKQVILEQDPDQVVNIEKADDLFECKKLMVQAKFGKKNGYLLEGMACPGGCVGGPGNMVDYRIGKKAVEKHMQQANTESPLKNKNL